MDGGDFSGVDSDGGYRNGEDLSRGGEVTYVFVVWDGYVGSSSCSCWHLSTVKRENVGVCSK